MTDAGAATDVVEAYARPRLGGRTRWDEMVDPAEGVRQPWREVGSVLRVLGAAGLAEQRRQVATLLAQDGVTYRPYGTEQSEPWALDPVPLLLEEQEWARLEPALVQRCELLDLILTDVYGPRRLLADGLIPPEIVFGHDGFVRAVDQIRIPGPRQLFLTAADLARGPDGHWRVLSDRTQAPSGTGYAMANRRVVSRALPGLYRDSSIQRLGPFFQAMRVALHALAPDAAEVPRIVLLTSGAGSETAFDQAFLSSLLGFPLVEGADLVVRDGHLWQRSLGTLVRVDVVLRRVDASYCDPLELRPDSQLGVPGLVEASRLGTVSVVNGLGAGVLENPALFPYLPRLSEVLLGQPLALPSAQTWWCGDETSRSHVLANLESLVIKPVSRSTTGNSIFGWNLTSRRRAELARRISADPTAWVGQEAVHPSTAPGAGPRGLVARPVTLRTFAVADNGTYRLLPGGLGRAAGATASPGSATRTGPQAKDVWVMSGAGAAAAAPEITPPYLARGHVDPAVSPRVAESLFWLGRYAERAEDVSRLVAVTDDRWREVHAQVEPAVPAAAEILVQALVDVTAAWPLPSGAGTDPHATVRAVIGHVQRPGTLAHDVSRVRELASASRDQLSTDTWAVFRDIDGLLARVGNGAYPDADVAGTMNAVRAALMAFAGLAAESMVRDAGWHAMDAGRRIERALQVARLLRSTLADELPSSVATLVEESTLIASESIITHRRRYPAQSGTDTVLELLLADRDNPRSLAFQLDRLAVSVRLISPAAARQEEFEARVVGVSARLRAVDCASLATAADGHRRGLTAFLDSVVHDLHQLAAAIEKAHFAHRGVLQPLGAVDAYSAGAAV